MLKLSSKDELREIGEALGGLHLRSLANTFAPKDRDGALDVVKTFLYATKKAQDRGDHLFAATLVEDLLDILERS